MGEAPSTYLNGLEYHSQTHWRDWVQPFYLTFNISISPLRRGNDIYPLLGLLDSNSNMFSSFSSFASPLSLPRFLGGNPGIAIDLMSVEVHDVETRHEKRARTLKHLLKLNHANHSIVYHHLQFHNHMPHVRPSPPTQSLMAELIPNPDTRIRLSLRMRLGSSQSNLRE